MGINQLEVSSRREALKLVAEGLEPSQRAEYVARLTNKSTRILRNGKLEEVTIQRVDLSSNTAVVTINDRRVTLDLLNMDESNFYRTLLVFENLILSNQSTDISIPTLELLEGTIPTVGQQVRFENDHNLIVGKCLEIKGGLILVEGVAEDIVDGERTSANGTFAIEIQEFVYNGTVIDNQTDIEIEPAKPVILGELNTIEEIADFLTRPELTPEQRSEIKDYLIYRKTKPTAFKDIPEDAYAKARFVDSLIGASIKEGQKVGELISAARQNILNIIQAKGTITTKKGTVLNLNAENAATVAENAELITLTADEYTALVSYASVLLSGEEVGDYNRVYNLAEQALTLITQKINTETDDSNKKILLKLKKALGVIVQAYFDYIDSQIDEERVLEVERVMQQIVNSPENTEHERGSVKMVMINGYTGAGKGTTLALLNARAAESGTDGIAGRGEGYESYEKVMAPYDLARFAGEYIPNRLMRLLFATEVINQRVSLDNQGRYNDPVFVSGFPRTSDQAKLFEGIDGIKAVSLNITPETAIFRVARRMIENVVLKGRELRGDDLSDITLNEGDNRVLTTELLMAVINTIKAKYQITDVSMITPEAAKLLTDVITLAKSSRYFRYNRDKKSIEASLLTLGVNVYQIDGDTFTPAQVTEMVKDYIDGVTEA